MPSFGPFYPSDVIDKSDVGFNSWSSPEKAKVEDNDWTFVGAGSQSHYLVAYGFETEAAGNFEQLIVSILRRNDGTGMEGDAVEDAEVRVGMIDLDGFGGGTLSLATANLASTDEYPDAFGWKNYIFTDLSGGGGIDFTARRDEFGMGPEFCVALSVAPVSMGKGAHVDVIAAQIDVLAGDSVVPPILAHRQFLRRRRPIFQR